MISSICDFGFTLKWLRMFRTERIISCNIATPVSMLSFSKSFNGVGHGAIVTAAAGSLRRFEAALGATWFSVCQISSLTNGITGVEQPKRLIENEGDHALRIALLVVAQIRLGHLDVPVAELPPEKVVEGAGRLR